MKSTFIKLLAGLSLLSVPALGAVPAGATIQAFTNGLFTDTGGTYVSQGGGWDTLSIGSTTIPGWTVTAGNVDWIGSYWPGPVSGDPWSIDMNGNKPGAISQTFSTVPGATYVVQFYLSGNGDGGPEVKTVSVDVGTGTSASYSTVSGQTAKNGDYTVEGYSFTADNSGQTTLTFAADTLNTSYYGPVIGDVTVTQVASSGADCKQGGWKYLSNPSTLLPFMNQGSCVSYFATTGQVPIGSGM